MFIAAAALAVAALSAFVAYEYMYVSISFPDNDLFFGKTINASGLYHPEQYTWYTYDQIDYWISKTDPPTVRMTTVYDNEPYNGTPALHRQDIYTYNRTFNGTLLNVSQINDEYYDLNGRWLAGQMQAFQDDALTNVSSFNCFNSTYHKYAFLLDECGQIAPRGRETITVGNKTYECDKYYQPAKENNIWFADSIPVPVKVEPVRGNMNVAFELVAWG